MTKAIIVGTAGHIDHGKTALVRALTGIDADRLPEEKRRGITIDLGFADMDLDDVRVGFVDVPGHERFVKNMVAGAHGIDAVALVIAADEGVMPQTREHFDICRLLDVRKGLVVITKADLVDEELLELVRIEARELVKGSFLEGAPIVAVSSRTGDGIEKLKQTLHDVAVDVGPRGTDLVTRLPIDRAFTMRGFGVVVTGTLVAGGIGEGDELELLPLEYPVRVRGVQVHGSAVSNAVAGQRTAINLSGVEAANVSRGMVLAAPGRLKPTHVVDAAVQVLSDALRSLRSRQRVRVHIGTAEVLARVRVLENNNEIAVGRRGLAQLRFEAPVVGVLGDRFIIRSYSPSRTIGGGQVLDPFAPRHRGKELPQVGARLRELLQNDRPAQLAAFVAGAEGHGLSRAEVAMRTGWRDEIIQQTMHDALVDKDLVNAEGVLITRTVFDELKQNVINEVTAHHKREPLSRGLPKEILRERHFGASSPEVFRSVLTQLEAAKTLVQERDVLRLPDHTRALSGADAELRDRLEKVFSNARFETPTISEAFSRAGLGPTDVPHGRKILQLLFDSGALVRVHGEMFFHRSALDELTRRVRDYAARTADRTIDVAAFKELTGISRKYAIPLLEYLDRQRITRRNGDKRVIL
jgi:selenocysteine-specific elongation factor